MKTGIYSFKYQENGLKTYKKYRNEAVFGLILHFPCFKISFSFELLNPLKKRKMSSHPTKLKGKNTSHHKEFHKKAPDFSGVLL